MWFVIGWDVSVGRKVATEGVKKLRFALQSTPSILKYIRHNYTNVKIKKKNTITSLFGLSQ